MSVCIPFNIGRQFISSTNSSIVFNVLGKVIPNMEIMMMNSKGRPISFIVIDGLGTISLYRQFNSIIKREKIGILVSIVGFGLVISESSLGETSEDSASSGFYDN